MAYDELLASRIRRALAHRSDFTERKMFGGLAFLCQGRMCCGIVGNDLMVRVAVDEFDATLQIQHVRPMDFTGKRLRGFVYVSPPGFSTSASLRAWLSRGERAAGKATGRRRSPSSRSGEGQQFRSNHPSIHAAKPMPRR